MGVLARQAIRIALAVSWASLVLCPACVRAQDASEPLILDHADSSEVLQPAGEYEYHLFGNVRFRHGRSRIAGDRAVWYQKDGRVRLDGNVRINQPHRFLGAAEVLYFRDDRSVTALGDVIVNDTTESFSLESQRVHFDRERDIARADSMPVMYWDFLLDSASQTIIKADTLYFFRDQRHGVAIGSVGVWKGDWVAEGEYGEIWPDSGRAVLTGRPKANGLGGIITGDTLTMYFQGKSVDRVRAHGQASGSYRDSSAAGTGENLIRGRTTDFFLANDSLRAIRVVGEAYTDYQPDEPGSGVNHASGDSLWLRFEEGQLSTVTIEGGAKGQYREGRPDGGEDTVRYQAERIVFAPDSNRIDLETNSEMHYGVIQLESGRISYWTDSRNLIARPLVPESDTAEVEGRPHLADGQQLVVGDTLTYNIDSQRGRIRGSSTEFEGAYYYGQDLRKYTDDIFFVSDGVYTTCDREEPHFRFEGRDMEVIRNDKVIARPVVLRIGELPVAILPYYVFPIRQGRHSGFLPIRFGNFDRGNRFIGNVGYYWSASDYWDIEGAMDFNEETGLNLRSTFNYQKRYLYRGTVTGSYARETTLRSTGRSYATRWSLQGNHSQTLSETARLSGNANFISDKSYYEDYVYDPNDRRQRTVRSQINLSKSFTQASLTAYVQGTQNLDTEDRTLTLPDVRLSFRSRRLFAPDSGQTARWYHNAYVSLSSQMKNFNHQWKDSTYEGKDTVVVSEDSIVVTNKYDVRHNQQHYATANHSGSISFPQRFFGNITISPALSFQETWYYVFDTQYARDRGVPVNDPGRRLAGSFSVGANTNLYGFLNPRLFGLSAIRHTLTPSVGYSFTPPVKQNDELRSYTGAGSGSSLRSQALRFSLSNVFDAKLGEGETERKVSLLNANLSASYNLESETHKWSTLSGSARTTLASRLDLQSSASWDVYNEKTGDLQWTNPRLLNFDLTAAMNLRGTGSALTSVTEIEDSENDSLFTSDEIPFNIGLSYRYTESHSFGITDRTNWISIKASIQPTEDWSLTMNSRYDWERRRVTDQTFEVNRDLHCWKAQFVWRPGGSGQGYYFRIGVKDIPDIKIERSESGLRGAIWR